MDGQDAMMRAFVVKAETSGSEVAVRIGDESSHVLQRLRHLARTRRQSLAPIALHAVFVVPSRTFLRHPNLPVIVLHVPVHVPTQSHERGPQGAVWEEVARVNW